MHWFDLPKSLSSVSLSGSAVLFIFVFIWSFLSEIQLFNPLFLDPVCNVLFGHFVAKICQAYAVCYSAWISGKSRSIRNVHFMEGMDTFSYLHMWEKWWEADKSGWFLLKCELIRMFLSVQTPFRPKLWKIIKSEFTVAPVVRNAYKIHSVGNNIQS